ncbi:hypothetical protein C7974DRAFT_322549, partial [Boeremia exigua]|uniref:uncharacterized protein n=1 Tax=Boeremia exigua TaxID=749465 RepID=UPI001E8E4C29
LPLNAPFKYNADTSEPGKSNFGVVIQWYFMGKIKHKVDYDYIKYCPRLYNALKKIDAEKRAEKTVEILGPEEPRGAEYQRSGHRGHPGIGAGITSRLITPVKSPAESLLVNISNDEHSDLDKLHTYLDSYGALYLLKNLPDPDEVQFLNQSFLVDAQPRKLLIGHHKERDNEIYAYMRKSRKFHEIKFYIEDLRASSKTAIRSEDVAKQRILHPFDKTYPKGTHSIGQDEKARLTLMVKWYFIAAGIAKDCVLRETKAYPERLRNALEYIAKRMGAASIRPPVVGYERQTEPETTSEEANPVIDKSHVQLCPAEVTPNLSSSRIQTNSDSPRPSTTHVEQLDKSSNTVDDPEVRGRKRTAEDAEFEDLAEIVSQVLTVDRDLTNQINDIDKQIELLQTQRRDLVEERKDVKRRFRRQTLAIASRTDG